MGRLAMGRTILLDQGGECSMNLTLIMYNQILTWKLAVHMMTGTIDKGLMIEAMKRVTGLISSIPQRKRKKRLGIIKIEGKCRRIM